MKNNVLFLLTGMFLLSLSLSAQRGVRIGYIDTEYILENVSEYQEASSQLDSKVQKWKGEIESKLAEVTKKRKNLSNEKPLLTKELIDEREEDIDFEEKEILDYQQKRFGPNGDLMIQKKQLMQPIQDQIFAAVQDIAEGRKYDFIFDKSSDAVMLYSAKQFDLSEQIIRSITRASKRTQVSSKAERKAAEDEEVVPEINEEQEAREKALEDKRDERDKATEVRRQEILDAREAKKKEAEARRQQILDDREKAKQEKLAGRKSSSEESGENANETDKTSAVGSSAETKTKAQLIEENRQQILEDREKAKQEKLAERKSTSEESPANKNETEKTGDSNNNTEIKTRAQLIEENRQKKLEEREVRKKELEERKRNILEERERVKDSLSNNK